MNHFGVRQQNAMSFCDEIRSASSIDRRDSVVCPKPRRLGLLNGAVHDPHLRSLRWQLIHQSEPSDSRSETDVLDAILTKGGNGIGTEPSVHDRVASPPPFFSGSPPSRVANPIIQDAQFGNDKLTPLPIPPCSGLPSPPPSARKGGCVRANFGNKPAVRVEGFDCLDRDRRNCRIPALA